MLLRKKVVPFTGLGGKLSRRLFYAVKSNMKTNIFISQKSKNMDAHYWALKHAIIHCPRMSKTAIKILNLSV